MNAKIILLSLSASCIIISFFFGYLFALRQQELVKQVGNSPQYVDITTSTRNITIKNSPENVFFRINGTVIQSGSIDLK